MHISKMMFASSWVDLYLMLCITDSQPLRAKVLNIAQPFFSFSSLVFYFNYFVFNIKNIKTTKYMVVM